MKPRIRIVAAVLVFVTFVCVADSAKAVITDVNILPEVPAVEDVITIVVSGIASRRPSSVTDSDFRMEGASLELDILLKVGGFMFPSPWSHSEIIGTLPADSYNLTVNTYYNTGETETYSTSFAVVPEPASILLLSIGIVAVRVKYRGRLRQYKHE